MNNAKLWLVVKPGTGIPIFLTAVAVGSLAVHVAVLSKTDWYNKYASGVEMSAVDEPTVRTTSMPASDGDRVTVILPDGRQASAVIEAPSVLAEARPGRSLATE